MHMCPDEVAVLVAAREHTHCLVCWIKVGWQWMQWQLRGRL